MNLIMAHILIWRCGNFSKSLKQNSFKVVYQMAGQVGQGGVIASPAIILTAPHLLCKLSLSRIHTLHSHSQLTLLDKGSQGGSGHCAYAVLTGPRQLLNALPVLLPSWTAPGYRRGHTHTHTHTREGSKLIIGGGRRGSTHNPPRGEVGGASLESKSRVGCTLGHIAPVPSFTRSTPRHRWPRRKGSSEG